MRASLVVLVVMALAAVLMVRPAAAEAPEGECSVAVLDLKPQGLAESQQHVPATLTDTIATELGATTGCRVVTTADIANMLDFEAQKMACDSEAASCLAEIGGALGVKNVVAGSVAKLGGTFTVQLKRIDIVNAQVLKRVELATSEEAELRDVAKQCARRLYDLEPLVAAPAEELSSSPSSFSPALLWTGVALVAVGVVAAGVGAGVAVVVDGQLGEVSTPDKDAVRAGGLVAVGVAAGGALVGLGGLALIPFAFLE